MSKLLLFIPGYNCEKQITRVLNQLDETVLPYISQVIMVNNRSTDGTEQKVCNFAKEHPEIPLKLLRNHENYNLGGSHKVAFRYAVEHGFDYVVVLHGDDQGDIHDLLPLFQSREYERYDCCLGARFMKGSKLIGYSRFRIFGNRVYNLVFSAATFRHVRDLGSGLNLYSTEMLKNEFFKRYSDTLMFNCYMLLANAYYKFHVLYFPISWREDDQVSNVKMFNQAMRTLKIAGGYFFSDKKKYMAGDFRDKPVSDYTAEEIVCRDGEREAEE